MIAPAALTRQPLRESRQFPWAVLVLILSIAFALRIAGIAQQSIWYDEGLSIYYARGSVGEVISSISASEHPPLHSLVLALWMALFGDSELSVRLLSAWWGILAVALTYRLGRRLHPASSVLAALFLAVSPLAIWFSQETRGYTMALALTTAAVDVAWGLLPNASSDLDPRDPHRQRWPRYLLYVVLATAALYTHLYSAFVLVALNVAWVIHQNGTRRGRRAWMDALGWIGAQLAVLVLFAPWLPTVGAQWRLNATYYHGTVDWKQIVRRTLIAFSVGETLEGSWAIAATCAFLTLFALGTVALCRRREGRWALLVLWLWMLVPLSFQIALNRNLPKYAPRYLLNAQPPFLILASAGISWLREQLDLRAVRSQSFQPRYTLNAPGWLATLVLLLATAVIGGATTRSLANHHLDRSLYRPDVRGAARYIQDHATDKDLIVLLGGHNYPAFTYYYRAGRRPSLPIVSLPDSLLPDTRAPVDVRALGVLDQAIAGRQHLWLVLWQDQLADPTGLVVDTLEHTYNRLGVGATFHKVGLLLFDVSPGPRLSPNAAPSSMLIANFNRMPHPAEIRLRGYDLPGSKAQPGDTLYLYLYWESLGKIEHDYKVFTQILDTSGNIVAQHDKVVGAESYPTSHWAPGVLVRDRFMLTVRPDAPLGRYTLIAGLYRSGGNMPRLRVSGQGAQGDHVVLAEIEVQDDQPDASPDASSGPGADCRYTQPMLE